MANGSAPAASTSRWLYITPFAGQDRYDAAWWRAYWKRLPAEGVVIPADGVNLAAAARADGLRILARMDMGGLSAAEVAAHPDWAALDAQGKPIQLAGGVAACVNRGYFKEQAPQTVTQLINALRADGVLGAGWSGMDRTRICYCPDCARDFRAAGGGDLPAAVDMDLAGYWSWADWNVKRRNEIWSALDVAARQTDTATYGWTGVIDADRLGRAKKFQDVRAVAKTAAIVFVENTAVSAKGRFRLHLDNSRYLTALLGSRPVVTLTPTHEATGRAFALTSGEPAEVRLRMVTGFAGNAGCAVALNSDPALDRRASDIAPPVMAWRRTNDAILTGRSPAGRRLALVWSASSADRYGRAQSSPLADAPYRGMVAALVRNHLPYSTLDAQDLTGELSAYSVLILPNVAAMSDAEANAVRSFVRAGGSLIATGETSLYDPSGAARPDFALADVFGAHRPPASTVNRLASITPLPWTGPGRGTSGTAPGIQGSAQHDYVRLRPQLAATRAGPHPKGEASESGKRHPVLAGFDDTDLLPFGGNLTPLRVDSDRFVTMTFIPPIPSLPPDEVYIREDRFDSPGLIVGKYGQGRVAFMPADFDRRLGMDPLIDHYALMTNVFNWTLGAEPPLTITGRATVASSLFRQDGKLVLHLVNLTGADNQIGAVTQYTPVGPLRVSVQLPSGVSGRIDTLAVSGTKPAGRVVGAGDARRLEFDLASLLDHEVVVVQ